MLVQEIAIEEEAEQTRAAALTEAGQIAARARHRDAVGKMKQFASWFTHGIPNGSALRKAIFDAKSGPAVLASVESFFAAKEHAAAGEGILV
jgi:tRNA-dihydrouridine synthase